MRYVVRERHKESIILAQPVNVEPRINRRGDVRRERRAVWERLAETLHLLSTRLAQVQFLERKMVGGLSKYSK